MALALTDRWIWDFWFAEDGSDVHVFYLQAPRSLGAPDLRHHNASIGHAVSADLVNWTVLADALHPGPAGAFDDLSTWTGSIVRHAGLWWLFYTGISRGEGGAVQRVGSATSPDLLRWTRTGGPPLEADGRWYEKRSGVATEAWRDPWVFWDSDSARFHLLLCARAKTGPSDGRGVIGHAFSTDLQEWQVGPPLSEPGEFSQLEVPQLVWVENGGNGGGWWVLFSAQAADHSAERRARPGVRPEAGTHYLRAHRTLGPYVLERDDFLVGDLAGLHYAGRILTRDGHRFFFAWQQYDAQGAFLGALSDPMPVTATAGRLHVQRPFAQEARS